MINQKKNIATIAHWNVFLSASVCDLQAIQQTHLLLTKKHLIVKKEKIIILPKYTVFRIIYTREYFYLSGQNINNIYIDK